MKRFTQLGLAIDCANRDSEKEQALVDYFREAPGGDAIWALFFLAGRQRKRAVSPTLLRAWIAEASALPLWLVQACCDAVDDLSEALALLLPEAEPPFADDEALRLRRVAVDGVLRLAGLPDLEKRALLLDFWPRMDRDERLVFNRLILGAFRAAAARPLLARAFAEAKGIPWALAVHRLMGDWQPTTEGWAALSAPDAEGASLSKGPYPFFLAHPLEAEPETLGDTNDWQAEWHWDGIRAQLVCRDSDVQIWSPGEELVTDRFPELAQMGAQIEAGVVLDGEILAWNRALDVPMPVAALQTRLRRKAATAKDQAQTPVILMACDLLELNGADLRRLPLRERRARLEALVNGTALEPLRLSPVVPAADWADLRVERSRSRDLNAGGLILKSLHSAYGLGRQHGDWWKWAIEPYTINGVLIYARQGAGDRAGRFTDCTFGVWYDGTLVPIARASTGFDDAEAHELDQFVRRHILERHGPVRVVTPSQVFELAFQGVQESHRHKAGVSLQFPRVTRWRRDKIPTEADTLEAVMRFAASGTSR